MCHPDECRRGALERGAGSFRQPGRASLDRRPAHRARDRRRIGRADAADLPRAPDAAVTPPWERVAVEAQQWPDVAEFAFPSPMTPALPIAAGLGPRELPARPADSGLRERPDDPDGAGFRAAAGDRHGPERPAPPARASGGSLPGFCASDARRVARGAACPPASSPAICAPSTPPGTSGCAAPTSCTPGSPAGSVPISGWLDLDPASARTRWREPCLAGLGARLRRRRPNPRRAVRRRPAHDVGQRGHGAPARAASPHPAPASSARAIALAV